MSHERVIYIIPENIHTSSDVPAHFNVIRSTSPPPALHMAGISSIGEYEYFLELTI